MFGKKKETQKEVTLDDIVPLHPEAYPAKHLKERLDARRDTLDAIKEHNSSEGLQDTNLWANA